MLRQESEMWARGMEQDAQRQRRDAAKAADMRRREKLQQPNTAPVGRWKVAQATAGAVTLYDFEAILVGHAVPAITTLYQTDLGTLAQLIHQVRIGGRIG